MSKLLSALVGLSMLGLAGAVSAAEPMALTDAQMDAVTAGQVTTTGPYLIVNILGNLNSTTGLNADFQTATFFVTALQ